MNLDAVFPPVPTPFHDGEVDPVGLRRNVEALLRAPLGGIVALGSNGEAPLLDDDECDRVVGEARAGMPEGRLLIAGTGRESTRATIAASRRAAGFGADAVLVRTPSYFKSRMTSQAFVEHYTAVADASPVPVLLYNYPAVTGVNLAPDVIARLSEHPNAAGIKETGTDAAQFAAYVDAASPRFAVIAGSAPAFHAALCVGARGAILAVACVVPELCVELLELHRAGRHEEAQRLQRRLTPLAKLVTSVHGVPGLKAAMEMQGFAGGRARPPLGALPDAARAEIGRALEALRSATAVRS